MCLIIFAWDPQSDTPLVVAANRDEFHARPTAAATFWPQYPWLLAGRDLSQGGTWMGFTRDGRFAAITNYRDPGRTAPGRRSRGELPLDYLTGDTSPRDYLREVAGHADDYAGFNILAGRDDGLWCYGNSGPEAQPGKLAAGIYGLSNARLDTPWPKVTLGKLRLRQLLESAAPCHEALQQVVADTRPATPEELHPLGLDQAMAPQLSAQFIRTRDYGTRSTTTLRVRRDSKVVDTATVSWRELSFDDRGQLQGSEQRDFSCRWRFQATGM
ncbi:NRDE family protein [Kineobactrum salinum]|uniref:NRDE family protein n=1 Tax=Kineobactrum salinum TaxID=2708301 RepID=A0A6C0U500_9GAMM|nr:NRDE family protein [Kineobactrum salinum]QIB65475.1 NRDE family protein [Kineobactrum salinum]